MYNEVRYLDGSLHVEHDIRTVGDGLTVSPLSELNLLGEEFRTDLDGLYSVADEELSEDTPLSVWLNGRRTRVYNIAGDEATLEVTGDEQVWTATDTRYCQNLISTPFKRTFMNGQRFGHHRFQTTGLVRLCT